MNCAVDFSAAQLHEIYGANCFSDSEMRARLPKSVYKEVKEVQEGAKPLTLAVAEVVASAMKDWAIDKGATHYTHWFQPLTGSTAEKHDSFISPLPDGKVMMEFSGKELIKGEPDASSFPSGGLRATFEARGYTAWDTTSPAFVREDESGVTLCIPTAFVSYNGEALDKKVPLLRSMDALNAQALRVLKTLGVDAGKVTPTIGPEQEYFLIQRELYDKRSDLMLSGRTVFGTMPAKGQEMDDHYFGNIKEKAAAFMSELNYELWKLGISAKTQHNEVAPNQFELAPIFDSANVATDRNQLVMASMEKIAARHGMVALLHEKPFAGVNGSGKHNNWSMSTDTGLNLLEPGASPEDNANFLLFLVAVIKAVDVYADLLRATASNSGNDHRLGANEAPPAIISIFLGEQLESILESLSEGKPVQSATGETLEIGMTSLPDLPKDLTDRNRTSPFAFTGNKFEFRMVPSSASIAGPNTALNTAVAEILSDFADRLEKASDIKAEIAAIVKETYKAHKRVIFNGNGYSDEWVEEAEKRGLPNIKSTIEAIPVYEGSPSVELFGKHGVFSKEELESRVEIYLEKYSMQINVEAKIMVEMAEKQIYAAAARYGKALSETILKAKEAVASFNTGVYEKTMMKLSENVNGLMETVEELKALIAKAGDEEDVKKAASLFRNEVFAKMGEVREYGDALEEIIPKDEWPFPTYEDLLFRL
ncbi:MAG: glutamine synthetase III [Spirochaetales bacterium]|uniref:Glutamine synthetase III n=1 Tax=Candidatus Thalassospirochaeta sargassi TaxID=3119039 RepID=A0AAJ1MPS2_9SPIO|nr:glutamine synthetase III [Spirochaetales bacterium]